MKTRGMGKIGKMGRMGRAATAGIAMALASMCLQASAAPQGQASSAASARKDLADYASAREACEHWGGEFDGPGMDPGRVKEINEGAARDCAGVDARLRALKRRHRFDKKAMAELDAYQGDLEGPAK